MSKAAIDQSIAFLERQKEANCPCTIHTQKRGFDWIVFNRLPDRIPPKDDGYQGTDSDETTGIQTQTKMKMKRLECLIQSPIRKDGTGQQPEK